GSGRTDSGDTADRPALAERRHGRFRRHLLAIDLSGHERGGQMPTTLSPSEMAAKASFVFQGTVQQLNAATIPDVSDKSNTAIVRVDRTIQAPRALSHSDGQNITVHLAGPEGLKAGDQAVFFTNAWLFGNEGVAVRSMGHQPPAPAIMAMHESLND